ncbi:zinc ABC transporter ATP-binding protein ZnuC [Buchnera aphidicola]|uniref:zinc ABC transporter ATP-binding protein ZnuC n=1 Tax=Buchnera aphidicola TaxID=9 RepID=UPI0034645738
MYSLIQLKNIFINFNHRCILSNISLNLIPNQILTLIGPNGAGKSTLVKVILGLLKPNSGKIFRKINLKVGYVPQKLYLNTALPITVDRFMRLSKGITRSLVTAVLNRINIVHIQDYQLQRLSGGEMQRMLLARALLKKPELLILDECTEGIDITGQIALYKLINNIRYELQCSVLIVSHDLNLVMARTDEVICLNQHICCSGTPEIVCKNSEFISIFGVSGIKNFALYRHEHNHHHDF